MRRPRHAPGAPGASPLQQAVAALQAGDAAAALERCEAILRAEPRQVGALNIGAVAAHSLGHATRAREMLQRAAALAPGDAGTQYNLGTLLSAEGMYEEAAERFRAAIAAQDGYALAHYNLATALNELGRFADAVAAYRAAVARDPQLVEALIGAGFALRAQERFAEAAEAYRQAAALRPEDPRAHCGLAIALQGAGRLAEAADAARIAVAHGPDDPEATANLADVLVALAAPEAAVAACDAFLARNPGHSGVLAAKSIALSEAGADAAQGALVDFDRFLTTVEPVPPPPFDSIEAFNVALAAAIVRHPSLTVAPTRHATRLGKHTGEILGAAEGPLRALETMLEGAVRRYAEALPAASDHPFAAARPARWRLTAWAIVLEGQGYQLPHIHPSAWLGGVYYVQVPDVVASGAPERPGWLEFGEPGRDMTWRVQPPRRLVQPRPGLMALFPAYFFHRTIPFAADGPRISVAFDVMPAG